MKRENNNICTCGSNSFFVKSGWFFCSYCKKPNGMHRNDLIAMTNEEIKEKLKEINEV